MGVSTDDLSIRADQGRSELGRIEPNEAIASDQRVVPEGSGRAYDWAFAHLTAEAVVVPESGTVDDRSPT